MENSSRFLKLSGTEKRGQKKGDREKEDREKGDREKGDREKGDRLLFFQKKLPVPFFSSRIYSTKASSPSPHTSRASENPLPLHSKGGLSCQQQRPNPSLRARQCIYLFQISRGDWEHQNPGHPE